MDKKVDVLLSAQKSHLRSWTPNRLVERQTAALEIIAARLADIDGKLERMLKVIERENPATHPF